MVKEAVLNCGKGSPTIQEQEDAFLSMEVCHGDYGWDRDWEIGTSCLMSCSVTGLCKQLSTIDKFAAVICLCYLHLIFLCQLLGYFLFLVFSDWKLFVIKIIWTIFTCSMLKLILVIAFTFYSSEKAVANSFRGLWYLWEEFMSPGGPAHLNTTNSEVFSVDDSV